MNLVGYTDRLSVAPGESIQFMVSSTQRTYRADIVRLIHGDENPQGPGFKEAEIESPVNGEYAGRVQPILTGSYVLVLTDARLDLAGGVTLQAWVMPTTPEKGQQGLLGKWSASDSSGYLLAIEDGGDLALRLGDGKGKTVDVRSGVPLAHHTWSFVAASFDAADGRVRLVQRPATIWPLDRYTAAVEQTVDLRGLGTTGAPFLMAGIWRGSIPGAGQVGALFNGKIEHPRLWRRALTADEVEALAGGAEPTEVGAGLVAAWDFSREISSSWVVDVGPHGLDGVAVNMPMRAATGHTWTGDEVDFKRAPNEYAAIHFHDDDLEDANWEADFTLEVPEGLPSGVYAARLRSGADEDYLPFVVRPEAGRATAPIAYLIPTLTYLAYASEHEIVGDPVVFPFYDRTMHAAEYRYIAEHHLHSLYDYHADGTGVCYASWKRPLVNMRPKAIRSAFASPEHLAADLYLIDWMEQKGHRYDCLADENLHTDGVELLRPYKVVVTGTHPEYWSGPMLAALETYLAEGGRVMYLGGNGFYWVTGFDPERPHAIEVRRWGGTGAWVAKPGEYYLSTTGELGGLWRNRNRAPQKLLGVGFTSQGFDYSRPYHRQPDSFDPRAAFIFEGIGDDEVIGDFPSLTLRHGAAGYEIDRAAPSLGTPPHALVVATATGFSDSYQHVIEECLMSTPHEGGTMQPLVRADVVYFEGPNGGAVFSTGSIAWCGCLSSNHYDNNVSRITDNVLRRFAGSWLGPRPPRPPNPGGTRPVHPQVLGGRGGRARDPLARPPVIGETRRA
ncbi:MAG TPA: LamG domain-containing protein [Thermomicrobiales bacterium]